jgi:hypothetical protein
MMRSIPLIPLLAAAAHDGEGWGNHELQAYTNSSENVRQDGQGHLVIRALNDESGNCTSGRLKYQRQVHHHPANVQPILPVGADARGIGTTTAIFRLYRHGLTETAAVSAIRPNRRDRAHRLRSTLNRNGARLSRYGHAGWTAALFQ